MGDFVYLCRIMSDTERAIEKAHLAVGMVTVGCVESARNLLGRPCNDPVIDRQVAVQLLDQGIQELNVVDNLLVTARSNVLACLIWTTYLTP